MTYDVRFTAEAEDDLRGIFKYIAVNLQSVRTAAGILERLENSINTLAELPERFRAFENEPCAAETYV